jgi:hypothetical protein
MADTITPDDTPVASSATGRLWMLRGAFLGSCLGLVIAAMIVVAIRRSLPALSGERLQAAQRQWEEAAPRHYKIEITVSGAQPAVYFVEVESGEPTSATRNDIPLKQRRTWETWTVPGMFDTLASDVETLADGPGTLVVRCAFDPQYGFPAQYERIEMGTGQQVSWVVTHFDP